MKSSLFIYATYGGMMILIIKFYLDFFILLIIKHDLFEVFSIYYYGLYDFYDDYVLCPYMRG